jgi:hypothetical protein
MQHVSTPFKVLLGFLFTILPHHAWNTIFMEHCPVCRGTVLIVAIDIQYSHDTIYGKLLTQKTIYGYIFSVVVDVFVDVFLACAVQPTCETATPAGSHALCDCRMVFSRLHAAWFHTF